MKPAVLEILPWFRAWKTYSIKIKEKMEGVKKILTVGEKKRRRKRKKKKHVLFHKIAETKKTVHIQIVTRIQHSGLLPGTVYLTTILLLDIFLSFRV